MNADTDIDVLIAKYLAGEADGLEAMKLDDWRRLNPSNDQYFKSAEKVFSEFQPQYRQPQPDMQKAMTAIRYRLKKKSLRFIPMVAASLAFLMVLTWAWYAVLNQKSTVITSGELVRNVTLTDGSVVDVGAGSAIEMDQNFGKSNRKLTLKGSADFEVEHRDDMPFVVKSDELFIEDLGTKFTIINEPGRDTIFVIVNEGIVRLYDEYGNELVVKAGEKAWYIKSLKTIIADSSVNVIQFNFNATKLNEVVHLISQAYDVPIKLLPEGLGNCTLTTKFYDESLETMLDVISETLSLQMQKEGESYILSGKMCVQ